MCGIAGIYSFGTGREAHPDALSRMTYSLRHRGPDDSACLMFDPGAPTEAMFSDEPGAAIPNRTPKSVGLGHRRLSIIDLSSAGRQPMSDASGRYWIIFNGEVYNYIELATELRHAGAVFRTQTDTEVILEAFQRWGSACFSRFNGMWALAIYDRHLHQLVLARDRVGKKPLYYYQDDRCLVFASEPKALFLHPRVAKRPNLRKCALYAGRNYRNVDNDNETFFANVRQLAPGTSWVVGSEGAKPAQRYWTLSPDASKALPASEPELAEMYRELLESAVRIRLRSDVPVGAMLSGGMDSTSITALASRGGNRLHAFSAVTGTGYYDESKYIEDVVRHTAVQHSFVYPKAVDVVSTLRHMMHFHDEPICTVTWFSLYLIAAEIARSGIKVVLTGHGGDELLAGYWHHYHYYWHDVRQRGGDPAAEIAHWTENHGRPLAEIDRERRFVEANAMDRTVEARKYSQYVDAVTPSIRALSATAPVECPYDGELSRRLYLELLHETVPPVLRAEDRNMMTHSIENRCPFLDYRLAEFCFTLPGHMKVRAGLGKHLLREVTKDLLPESVRMRKDKTGHNAPADEWWRQEHETFEGLMAEPGFVNEEIYDLSKVKELFREHREGANHAMFFWQYLNLHIWHHEVVDVPSPGATLAAAGA